MSEHNGWTNYETWRVNLEMFDGFEIDAHTPYEAPELADYLKETAIQVIEDGCSDKGGFALDYALAFLDAVDFRQIAIRKIGDLTPADWKKLAQDILNQRRTA
jgi:hypothetical protein